jgi:uncharacterized protein (TIGR02145 family)
MKKILSLFVVIIAYSCSTSSDENGNSNTTIVPLPPTSLTGIVASTTQINLTWTDNSTNETGFKIERKTGTGTYTVVGTTTTDITTFNNTGLTPNTTYTYRVYAYNAVGNSLTYTNEVTLITTALLALPTLTTTSASSITQTAASSGGNISNDGGAAIIARGVCWSTSANPTIALITKTNDGAGTGAFTSNLTGLSANTTYFVRAYATNSLGVGYGNEISFTTLQNSTAINVPGPNVTDIDGNTYQSVTNCGKTWTKQNLNVSKYSDGTTIPQVTDPTAWANLTTGAWCYYNNDPANEAIYGKLYNWYAVAGIYDAASATNPALRKKLAPSGWHIPTDAEWTQLTDCLGGQNVAGGKMKATGTVQSGNGLWASPNTDATNESGFTGLPASSLNYDGPSFVGIGFQGVWWCSEAALRYLSYNYGNVTSGEADVRFGFSVRCLRD